MIGMKKDVMKELKVVIGSVQVPINSTINLRDSSISHIGKENKSNNEVLMYIDRNLLRLVLLKNFINQDKRRRKFCCNIKTLWNQICHIGIRQLIYLAPRLGLGESKKDRKDPI